MILFFVSFVSILIEYVIAACRGKCMFNTKTLLILIWGFMFFQTSVGLVSLKAVAVGTRRDLGLDLALTIIYIQTSYELKIKAADKCRKKLPK